MIIKNCYLLIKSNPSAVHLWLYGTFDWVNLAKFVLQIWHMWTASIVIVSHVACSVIIEPRIRSIRLTKSLSSNFLSHQNNRLESTSTCYGSNGKKGMVHFLRCLHKQPILSLTLITGLKKFDLEVDPGELYSAGQLYYISPG